MNNQVNTVINSLFDFSERVVDQKRNKHTPLPERILEILTPSYVRQGALSDEIRDMLMDKVKRSVAKEAPITLILAFGGFKGVGIKDSPHLNWAEVFHLSFLAQAFWEITQIYTPGVILEFSGDSIILPLLDNYPLEWTEVYNQELDQLIGVVNKAVPANMKFTNRPTNTFYKQEELEKEVMEEFSKLDLSLPEHQEKIKSKMHKAQNNYITEGINPEELQKRLEESVILHDVWLDVDYKHRREYLEGGINIPIAHRKGIPGCLCIRSVKSSDVQFWEAYGVINISSGKSYPTLLSHNQYDAVEDSIKYEVVNSVFSEFETLKQVPVLTA